MPGNAMPDNSQSPPPRTSLASTIAAHLDVGTIVTGIIGFSMVMLVQSGVEKLDKMTEQISQLNEKMVSVLIRSEYQDKRDNVQDITMERHEARMDALEKARK